MSGQGADSTQEPWRGFARLLLKTAAGVLVLLFAAFFVLDPYDTGRPGLISKPGVRPQGPRTAAASRGRDPAFTAAIFGNSHVQLLSPERLGSQTGKAFVSLIAPGTRPREQLALLDWYLRNRKAPAAAVVLGIDGNWCTPDAALPVEKPFPFWLYDRSLWRYATGLLRYDLIEEAPRRLGYLVKGAPERARPDGYWDYEPNYIGLGFDSRPDKRAALEIPANTMPANPDHRFPAAERLGAALAAMPAETRAILVYPPVYQASLPQAVSAMQAADTACKAAFGQVAAQRPNTAIVDWRRDTPETRDPALWFDHTHYRQPVARQIEVSIAATLKALD